MTWRVFLAVFLGVGFGTALAVGRALRQAVEDDKARWERLREKQRRLEGRPVRDEGDVA